MTVLQDVGRALLCSVGVLAVVHIVEVVGLIQVVPVELAERFCVPEVGVQVIGLFVVGKVGGEIAVVVRTRITCVVPVQGRCAVVDPACCGTGIELSAVAGLPYPVDNECGVKSLNYL